MEWMLLIGLIVLVIAVAIAMDLDWLDLLDWPF